VIVGDTPYDAKAAGTAGLKLVGVLCSGFPEKALRSAGSLAVFQRQADLLKHHAASPSAEGST
jgi:phosphoglycolate phosphatase-like HAD superfamily hydrolase